MPHGHHRCCCRPRFTGRRAHFPTIRHLTTPTPQHAPKKTMRRRIILLTDGKGGVQDTETISQVLQAMSDNLLVFQVVGLDFTNDANATSATIPVENSQMKPWTDAWKSSTTPGAAFLQQIVDALGQQHATCWCFSDALSRLSTFQKARPRATTTFRGCLSLGGWE